MSKLPTPKEVKTFHYGDFGGEEPVPVWEPPTQEGFELLFQKAEPPVEEDPREAARAEAAGIVEAAKGEAAGIKKAAHAEGYKKGKQEGFLASKARIEAAAENLGKALAVLEQVQSRVFSTLEPDLVAMVQAVTDAILLHKEAVKPSVIRAVVKEAVSRVVDAGKITVRVSQMDLGHVQEFRPNLLTAFTKLETVTVVADPELSPGDCKVETEHSEVDATLEERRRVVFGMLEETLRRGPNLDVAAVAGEAMAGATDDLEELTAGRNEPDPFLDEPAGDASGPAPAKEIDPGDDW